MLQIDHLDQRVPEQVSRLRSRLLRPHKTPTEFARKQGVIISFMAITDTLKDLFPTENQWATSCSAPTN